MTGMEGTSDGFVYGEDGLIWALKESKLQERQSIWNLLQEVTTLDHLPLKFQLFLNMLTENSSESIEEASGG